MGRKPNDPEQKQPKTRSDVVESTLETIRKEYGEDSIRFMGDGASFSVSKISTGILPLDIALQIGGLPRGRITEIFGPEGSGKTTLSLHTIAETQKAGGIAAFIDAEHALDPSLALSIGVNIKDLIIAQPDCGEQALGIVDKLARSGAVDIIVIDSVAALTPKSEIDGSLESNAQVGIQARLMSYALRRLVSIASNSKTAVVFINQLRAKISTGYGHGPSETTTGGRALKFYSSVRIEVKRGKAINKGDNAIGHELFIKVVKNKLACPFRSAKASLIYGKGIPYAMSILDMAIDFNVVKKKGSWLAYKGENLGQGKDSVATWLETQPALLEEIRKDTLTASDENPQVFLEKASEDPERIISEESGIEDDENLLELPLEDESESSD